MRRFNPLPPLKQFFFREEKTNFDKVMNTVVAAGLIAVFGYGASLLVKDNRAEIANISEPASASEPLWAGLGLAVESVQTTIRNPPPPVAKPGALPEFSARSKWVVTVSACLTKTYFEETKAKLTALGFTVSDKSRLFGAIDEFSTDPARFAKRNEVIFPRLEDEEIAKRIAYELNQLPALAKMEPKFAVDDADTPTVERKLYIHIGGRSCPLTKSLGVIG